MPTYEYEDYARGRSRTRHRNHRDYSPSEGSVDSVYSRRHTVQRDPTYDNPSYQVENTKALVVRQEYPVAAPAHYRSQSSDYSGYGRNKSRRRNLSVDTTQVYYPTRDGYYYERREYSVSPARERRRLRRRSWTRSRSRTRSRHRSPSPAYSNYSYNMYVQEEKKSKWKRPAEVAAKAAAVEAFRLRKEPGSWTGAKGTRVATVALAAAGINRVLEKNPDPDNKSTMKLFESIIGAKIVNRVLNGSRKNLRYEY